MRAAKRDRNEAEMVEAWRMLGALWIPMAPEAGFDGLLLFRGQWHIVEIKDTRQSNGRYYLTANEKRACLDIEQRGGAYEIVTNITEALALVEAE